MKMIEEEKLYALNASPLNFAMNSLSVRHAPGEKGVRPTLVYQRDMRTFEFLEDGGVQITINAPDASSVEVSGMRGTSWSDRTPLHREAEGVWRGVVASIPKGFQYMTFYFDGKERLCAEAPVGFGYGRAVNFIEVPDDSVDFYDWKDVPHGALRAEAYTSTVTGQLRGCLVYTPPSYDVSPDRCYPVLYVQHGGGENETAWFYYGKLHCILDNLIASNRCGEMIVVANAGYVPEIGKAQEIFLPGNLGKLLKDDCIPFIEQRFRALPGKENRAIAGVSMGGYQVQWAAFHSPELYDYIGIFSSYSLAKHSSDSPYDLSGFFAESNAPTFNAQHKLLFIGRGLDEDHGEQNAEIETIHRRNIQVEYFSCHGLHEWNVWRRCAHVFAQKIFR